ncbi:hypothetical protein H0H92_002711, partial [Tricholoma furcatifolium]
LANVLTSIIAAFSPLALIPGDLNEFTVGEAIFFQTFYMISIIYPIMVTYLVQQCMTATAIHRTAIQVSESQRETKNRDV